MNLEPVKYRPTDDGTSVIITLPSTAASKSIDIDNADPVVTAIVLFALKSNVVSNEDEYVNDVFDEHGVFNEEALFRKIKDKANIMSEMHMLKNAIPGVWKLSLLSDPCKLHVKPCQYYTLMEK